MYIYRTPRLLLMLVYVCRGISAEDLGGGATRATTAITARISSVSIA